MSRRFLTAEDVRRAGGSEILVEEGTVVTPQALEAARTSGLTIRTGAGDYREPTPDRGPDTERQQLHLPHMPEPQDELMGTGMVVTVVGRNRPGVLAEVTGALADLQANVNDISQKMVAEFFHMVLTVEAQNSGSFAQIKSQLEALGGEKEYVVNVMHERVFRFMHRV